MNIASTQSKTLRVAVEGRNLEDLLPLLEQFPCTIVTEAPELVITHGGDGSLLGAERKYPGIPKCPIRDRKRNPKCPRHDEMTTLKHLFEGKLNVSHLTKLQVTTQAGESLTGKAVLCFVHGMIPELQKENGGNWLKQHFSVVNGMLVRRASSFCFAALGDRLDANELLKIQQSRQGRVFFRVVTD